MGMRTAEEQKEAEELFAKYRAEVHERQRANTASYDKYLLTLSSSGLGISLGAPRFFSPAECLTFAGFSWLLFFVSICSALVAFLVSNKALGTQLQTAEDYYRKQDEKAFDRPNRYETMNKVLNLLAGSAFLLALIVLIIFVSINSK